MFGNLNPNMRRVMRIPCYWILGAALIVCLSGTTYGVTPQIIEVKGISDSDVISGRVFIEVRTSSTLFEAIREVRFELAGPKRFEVVDEAMPFILDVNSAGTRRGGWNTAKYPNGKYVLSIFAISRNVVCDSREIRFTVYNKPKSKAVSKSTVSEPDVQDTVFETEQTAQANVEQATIQEEPVVIEPEIPEVADDVQLPNIEVNEQELVSVGITAPADSQQDIVDQSGDEPLDEIGVTDVTEDADASQVTLADDTTSGDVQSSDVLSSDVGQNIADDSSNDVVLQITAPVEPQDDIGQTDDGQGSVPGGGTVIMQPVIEEKPVGPQILSITGISAGSTVTGKLDIGAEVTDMPYKVVFDITGPANLSHTERNAPYKFLGDWPKWDTSQYPEGSYILTVTAYDYRGLTDTEALSFTVVHELAALPAIDEGSVDTASDDPLSSPVSANPPVITQINDLSDGGVVSGTVYVRARVSGDKPEMVIFELTGPSSRRHTERNAPYYFLGDGVGWNTAGDPDGQYTMKVIVNCDGKDTDSRTMQFAVMNESTVPNPDDGTGSIDTDGTVADAPDNTSTSDTNDQPIDPGDDPVISEPVADNGANGSVVDNGDGSSDTAVADTTTDPASESSSPSPTSGNKFMGMNLTAVTFYTSEWVFVDVMKMAQRWEPKEIEVDENGWPILQPGQKAYSLIFRGVSGHYPAGRYVCTYEGTGSVRLGFDAKIVNRGDNRIEADVIPTNQGIHLVVESSDPNDRVRNIKVWMPNFEDQNILFHPLFLDRLRPFNVIRFMSWQGTCKNTPGEWDKRITPEYAFQSTNGGVCLEYMIKLCNTLKASPWFCMPHNANDEYVANFAAMVKEKLHKDATIYIEYSNEVWNGQFPQRQWLMDRANENGTRFDMQWAQEMDRDFTIWHNVFASDKHRVERVLCGQRANPSYVANIAEEVEGRFDAVSCACYFGLPANPDFAASVTPEEVVEAAMDFMLNSLAPGRQAHVDIAKEWTERTGRHIGFYAYEGGQHITCDGRTSMPYYDAMIECQRIPAMYDATQRNIFEFEKMGGTLFVSLGYVAQYSQWGSWGHLEYQDQPIEEAHKYRAVIEYMESDLRLRLSMFD